MVKNKIIIWILILFVLLVIIKPFKIKYYPAEEIEIHAGLGFDILEEDNNIFYKTSIVTYNFNDPSNITTTVLTGTSNSPYGTLRDYERKSSLKFIMGHELLYVIGEEYAKYGIKSIIDELFKNNEVSDTGICIVCKGSAEDIMKHKIPGFQSTPDYINNMVKSSIFLNFYHDNYKLIDGIVRLDSEGRNFSIPYIEIINNAIQLTGMVIFRDDKMIAKIDIPESEIMNMLREKMVSGILSMVDSPKEYIDFNSKCKRKVKCSRKADGRLKFNIDLNIDASILTNEGEKYKSAYLDPKTKKEFEKDAENFVKDRADKFIEKMQKDLKTDCLELGRVAVSKYGRNKEIDWNKEVINSEIEVSVTVKVVSTGRGDY